MNIVATYSFNRGKETIEDKYSSEFEIITNCINSINAAQLPKKISDEKTMPGKELFSPTNINNAFKSEFKKFNWSPHKELCDYKYGEFHEGYVLPNKIKGAFREMDFVSPETKVGVEVQFGKYSFMVYNVCAKMTIFNKLGIINVGVEIVPVKNLSAEMSSGVSYFEQFAWDLEKRGVSDLDIPVLILGIDI